MKKFPAFAISFLALTTFTHSNETSVTTIEPRFVEVDPHFDVQTHILDKSRRENNRNPCLDSYLAKNEIALPSADYLLIAEQPRGFVGGCIIIDFERRSVRSLLGTHSRDSDKVIPLDEAEYDYLAELNASSIMKNFPSVSGKVGMGGHSIVIYSKSGETERYISHWSPEYMGIDIFTSILDHFLDKADARAPKHE